MSNFKNLTSGEETLMQILWQLNGGYLKDIMQAYQEPKPHQNTISTFLKNLLEKNYISATQEGRINKYAISIAKADYKIMLLKNFLENFYENNASELIIDLMNEGLIDFSETKKDKKKKKEKKKDKKNKKK